MKMARLHARYLMSASCYNFPSLRAHQSITSERCACINGKIKEKRGDKARGQKKAETNEAEKLHYA